MITIPLFRVFKDEKQADDWFDKLRKDLIEKYVEDMTTNDEGCIELVLHIGNDEVNATYMFCDVYSISLAFKLDHITTLDTIGTIQMLTNDFMYRGKK